MSLFFPSSFFKASALWPNAFYKSKCPCVGCPIILKILNPWAKVMERSGLTFEHFCLEVILPYKTCWKPRFPMDERPLVEGYIANFGISLDVFEFLRFG